MAEEEESSERHLDSMKMACLGDQRIATRRSLGHLEHHRSQLLVVESLSSTFGHMPRIHPTVRMGRHWHLLNPLRRQ